MTSKWCAILAKFCVSWPLCIQIWTLLTECDFPSDTEDFSRNEKVRGVEGRWQNQNSPNFMLLPPSCRTLPSRVFTQISRTWMKSHVWFNLRHHSCILLAEVEWYHMPKTSHKIWRKTSILQNGEVTWQCHPSIGQTKLSALWPTIK